MVYTDLVFYYNGNIYNVSKSLKYNSDMSNPVSWTPPSFLVGVGNVSYYHDGTNLWTFDATNIKKYSADFTTLISATTYTRPTSIGSELFKCICSNSSDTLWFITSASKIVKYNIGSYTNGTVIKDMVSYSSSPYRALMYWSGKLYYGYKNMLAEFDSDNNITNLFVTPQDSSYGCAYALMADNVNHLIYEFCSLGTNRYGIVAYILYRPPAAQNLLAAPVTKTATNTMKIQYDFQIQKVL